MTPLIDPFCWYWNIRKVLGQKQGLPPPVVWFFSSSILRFDQYCSITRRNEEWA